MRFPNPSPGCPGGADLYYPPRARWYSRLGNLGYRASRRLGLDALGRWLGISTPRLLLSILLPAYACFALGRRCCGWIVLAGYGLAAVVFLIWLGDPAAQLAMGAMISLHVWSQLQLLARWPTDLSARTRIAVSLGVFLATSLLIYAPLRDVLQQRGFLPLRVEDRVVVISPRAPLEGVRRGDVIAYRIRSAWVGNTRLRAGYGIGRIEAMAGERIRFDEDTYTVQDVTRPRRAHMPQGAEWVVPQNHWFIWPDSAIKASGNADAAPAVVQGLALVPESQFAGKPFPRWFGRKQWQP